MLLYPIPGPSFIDNGNIYMDIFVILQAYIVYLWLAYLYNPAWATYCPCAPSRRVPYLAKNSSLGVSKLSGLHACQGNTAQVLVPLHILSVPSLERVT